MQISCGVHTEVSEEDVVWADTTGVGRSISGTGEAEGRAGDRRAFNDRSCAYADVDPAEIFSGAGDGFCERQECHSYCPGVCWPTKEFSGPKLLGAGLLGVDG